MARNVFHLILGAVVLAGCVNVDRSTRITSDTAEARNVSKYAAGPEKLLRHVVLLKFKDEAKAVDVEKVEEAFIALPGKVDAIYDLEWGTDVSVEGISQGFTHCFFVSFKSEADRAKYLPHPEHKAFGKILGPHLDKVIVVDYWAK